MQLRQAIVLLQLAVIADPGNYDASWRLAKFNYYLATHTDNSGERDKAFRDGIEAGKTAVELQGEKPDGHFWLGAIYGAAAQASSIAGPANVDDISNEMETVLRLDEGYQDGSAYMVLGLVYLNEPKFIGGDPQKAFELMEKGLHFGNANAFLHLHLAEAYLKVGRTADARKQSGPARGHRRRVPVRLPHVQHGRIGGSGLAHGVQEASWRAAAQVR